jgi:chromosome segregation ATPase
MLEHWNDLEMLSAAPMQRTCLLLQARQQNTTLTKDITWLTAAHAEQAALRRGLASQNQQLKQHLATEGVAHHQAVIKYADAMEQHAEMQIQLEEALEQVAQLQAQHQQLQVQHEELQGHYSTLEEQCRLVSSSGGQSA